MRRETSWTSCRVFGDVTVSGCGGQRVFLSRCESPHQFCLVGLGGTSPEVKEIAVISIGANSGDTGALDITTILDSQPDEWKVKVSGELEGDGQTVPVGTLELHFELGLQLTLEIVQEEELELADRSEVEIDSDIRERLQDVPFSDVQLFVEMDPVPFGFTVALEFTDGDHDPEPARLAVSVGVENADDGHDWRGVLDKLAGNDPHVQPVLVFAKSDEPISLPTSVTVKAHMIISADVNKR